MTRLGVDEHWLDLLDQTLKQHGVQKAAIFGSRARGDFKDHSDIDLAVWAPQLSPEAFARLAWDVDDLPMVFKIDLVRMDSLEDNNLRNQVLRDGVNFGLHP
jgi:predicted nucleotidyltransferase